METLNLELCKHCKYLGSLVNQGIYFCMRDTSIDSIDFIGKSCKHFETREADETSSSLSSYRTDVKEAVWEIDCDGYYPVCSNCSQEAPPEEVLKNHALPDICPHCGAVMTNWQEFSKERF